MEIERSNRFKANDDDAEIPDWLWCEVLLRLPLNSVFKCRIVSKQWLSIASDPYFIRAYASRASSSSQPPWIILSTSVSGDEKFLPKLVHNPSDHFILRELYLRPPQHGRDIAGHFSILGESNGLVLYCSSSTGSNFFDFYVCNPITGHRIRSLNPAEPSSLPWVRSPAWGFRTKVDRDFILRSYCIVQAVQSMEQLSAVIFNVYDSKTGDWKNYTVPLGNEYRLALQESAAVVNGILHWADTIRGGVIVYDPEANPEQIRLIPHPQGWEWPKDAHLCVANRGELRYFRGVTVISSGFPMFNIWKLVDYHSGEWYLEHKMRIEDINMGVYHQIGPNIVMEMVCFDPFDSDLVYFMNWFGRSTFTYNLRTETLDNRCEMKMIWKGSPFGLVRALFRKVLLVVPQWPIHVAEKHLARRGGG